MADVQDTNTQKFNGSCLCGFVSYTANIPIPKEGSITARRCNCAYCRKRGFTNLRLPSAGHLSLLTPSSPAELSDFASVGSGRGGGHRYFCPKCGVHVWMEAQYQIPGAGPNGGPLSVDLFSLNMVTLEQPQEGLDLSEVKIEYVDGLHDHFMNVADKPWSGGMV